MSEHNITVTGGTSTRLKTAGKYCDRDIIVTATGGEGNDPYFLFPYVKTIRLTDLDIFNTSDLVIDSYTLTTINQFSLGATNTKVTSITFNTPALTGITQAFSGQSKLQTISFKNGVTVSTAGSCFNGCESLETINGTLKFTGTSATANNYAFSKCYALKDVTFAGVSLKASISFSDSPNLSNRTISNILIGLADLTGSTPQTLTVHPTVYEIIINGGWDALYVTPKNWTLVSAE